MINKYILQKKVLNVVEILIQKQTHVYCICCFDLRIEELDANYAKFVNNCVWSKLGRDYLRKVKTANFSLTKMLKWIDISNI